MTSVQNSRVTDLIAAAATEAPDARALVVTADRVPITYRDLLRLATTTAATAATATAPAAARAASSSGTSTCRGLRPSPPRSGLRARTPRPSAWT